MKEINQDQNERLAILETKVQTILYLVSAILGIKGIEIAWPPFLNMLYSLF